MLIPKGGNVFTASTSHELRLRPEDRLLRPGRCELHLPGQGCEGGEMMKIDKALANNTLIFPTKEDARQRPHLRLERTEQPEVHRSLAEPDHVLTRTRELAAPPPGADAVPPARARAGIPCAVLRRPARVPRLAVAQVRELRRRLLLHVGLGKLLGRGSVNTAASSSARSSTQGSRPCWHFSSATRSRTGSRSAADGGRTSCCCSSSRRSSSLT